MKTQSKKAKGRNFQKLIVDILIRQFNLDPNDINWRSMGAQGSDIILSNSAREVIPFSIECKKSETLGIWKAIDQAEKNRDDLIPIVVFSKNHKGIYGTIDFDTFLEYYSNHLKFTKIVSDKDKNDKIS